MGKVLKPVKKIYEVNYRLFDTFKDATVYASRCPNFAPINERWVSEFVPFNVEDWAIDLINRHRVYLNPNYDITVIKEKGVVILFDKEMKRSFVSICNMKKDIFNADVGVAIAFCRATGISIPHAIFED